MNEKIKEILKDNDELIVVYNDNSTRTFDTLTIDVLDYITDLQQENEKLKYNARGQVNDYFKDKYADEVLKKADLIKDYELTCYKNYELKQENERLIKNQINSNSEHFRIIKENKRKIDNLRKQNKELKSDIEVLERVKNFYKRHSLKYYRRCDVALAWIETTKEIIEQQPTKDDRWILDKLNSFENILNGSDENETNN